MSFGPSSVERRAAIRFPLEREVTYKLLYSHGRKQEGVGRSVNLSSTGILFDGDQDLELKMYIEVTVLLDRQRPLFLVASGRVVRSQNRGVAVQFERQELRTEARNSQVGLQKKSS